MKSVMDIIGASRYSITNSGDVISRAHKIPRVLKGMNINGYRRVELFMDNGATIRVMVHRLVAQYFVPGMGENLDVNHKDGNKSNNKASNLEWVTRKQNVVHAFLHGLINSAKGEKCGNAKLSKDDVKWIRANHVPFKKGPRSRILKKYGISESNLRSILKRESWRHI